MKICNLIQSIIESIIPLIMSCNLIPKSDIPPISSLSQKIQFIFNTYNKRIGHEDITLLQPMNTTVSPANPSQRAT